MDIKLNKRFAVCSMDICNVNGREMRQMHELKIRIKHVLDSHKPEAKDRKYVNDDDLKLMYAVLSVFTKEYEETQSSAFDDFLAEQDKPATVVEQDPDACPIHNPFEEEDEGE